MLSKSKTELMEKASGIFIWVVMVVGIFAARTR